MDYERYVLHEDLAIRKLITFFYRETTRRFFSPGEKHDFWELVYVDKGEVDIFTDANLYEMQQGDIVFYKPNEFHAGKARNGTAPNLIIVSFDCDAPCMTFFENKSFRLEEGERAILSSLVKEGLQAFDPPIDAPLMQLPKRRIGAPFGCDQLIRNYLEILLIQLIRRGEARRSGDKPPSVAGGIKDQEMAAQLIDYMQSNLSQELSLERLCREFAIGRTRLKTLFKAKTGVGIMEYFNKLKIARAKQMIREEQYNFTEIAERLGYSSIHYFSKQFKRVTDMTPTEYTRSISARSGRK